MLKGTVAVVIAGYFGGPNAAMLAALGAFLGHLFPVWLKFKGGKGVAVYIGVLIGLFWPAAVVFCVLWLATATTSRYSSLSALVASFRHADFPVVVRPSGAGPPVRRADRAAVLHAPRKHQAVAGRHRGADRGEVIGRCEAVRLDRAPARRSAPPPAPGHRCQTARSPARRPANRLPPHGPGTLTQGTPISVHSRLKRGSPVDASPLGAAPGAENVSSISTSLEYLRQARLARGAILRASS